MLEGRCGCGEVSYQMLDTPLIVHCCHCTWCQRESGSAFAVNALIETSKLTLLQGVLQTIEMPSASGKGQAIMRCAKCKVAVWSHYHGMGDAVSFVRVGTLAEPAQCPPDIHIYTTTKQPWVILPDTVPAMPEYYSRSKYWSAASIERLKAVR